jgi:hypothetical protein
VTTEFEPAPAEPLTKREQFALAALQALISRSPAGTVASYPATLAAVAVQQADLLIQELDK